MSPTERDTILAAIATIAGRSATPVTTIAIATHLGFSDRHMRRKLNALARSGAIVRVGVIKGWLPSTKEDAE